MDGEQGIWFNPQEKLGSFPLDVKGKSIANENHPHKNEDAILISQTVFGLFDGVGGNADGDIASNVASRSVEESFQNLQKTTSIAEAQTLVRNALLRANRKVQERARNDRSNMGTTASIIHLWDGPNGQKNATVGNIGDSRVYVLRNGELIHITLDDNEISEAFNEEEARKLQIKISGASNPVLQLTAEELRYFKSRNRISQHLGSDNPKPRIYNIKLERGDRLIACSDGITDNLTDSEIIQILSQNPSSNQASNELIGKSQIRSREMNNLRSKRDDMSVIVIGEDMGDLSKNPKNELIATTPKKIEAGSLDVGSRVQVKRSNGKIESDWTIQGFDNYGNAIVVKKQDTKDVRKRVPISELEKLNKKATITDLTQAQSLDDLRSYIKSINGLQGSHEFYSRDELLLLIQEVLSGQRNIESITKTGGLRQKLADLIRMEKIRGSF